MVYQGGLRLGRKWPAWWSKSREESLTPSTERRPASQDQLNLREKGSTQFFEQGSLPCSFFCATGCTGALVLAVLSAQPERAWLEK